MPEFLISFKFLAECEDSGDSPISSSSGLQTPLPYPTKIGTHLATPLPSSQDRFAEIPALLPSAAERSLPWSTVRANADKQRETLLQRCRGIVRDSIPQLQAAWSDACLIPPPPFTKTTTTTTANGGGDGAASAGAGTGSRVGRRLRLDRPSASRTSSGHTRRQAVGDSRARKRMDALRQAVRRARREYASLTGGDQLTDDRTVRFVE